jgi:hypothetical protein
MKNLSLSFLAFFVLILASCTDKDETCVAPDVATNIIGLWDISISGGSVTFNTDSTFIDPSGALLSGEINGVELTEKTYSVTNDSLYLRAGSPLSSDNVSMTVPVTKNECDVITVTVIGVPLNMNRQ